MFFLARLNLNEKSLRSRKVIFESDFGKIKTGGNKSWSKERKEFPQV
jgi:hypothetical protein